MRSDSAMSSSHVVGTSYPASAKAAGEYHTSDFRLNRPNGKPYSVPSTTPCRIRSGEKFASTTGRVSAKTGTAAPVSRTTSARKAGCTNIATSGASSDLRRMLTSSSNVPDHSRWTSTPVHASKPAQACS